MLDLRHLVGTFSQNKLPTLIAIALAVLVGTQNRLLALGLAAVFLLITVVSDLLAEASE